MKENPAEKFTVLLNRVIILIEENQWQRERLDTLHREIEGLLKSMKAVSN